MTEIAFTFRQGRYGLIAGLKSRWKPWMRDYLLEHQVSGLTLLATDPWARSEPRFLSEVDWLLSCWAVGVAAHTPSLDSIHSLHELLELKETTYSLTALRFSEFPKLERCDLYWREGSESLFKCTTLRELVLDGYHRSDSTAFENLVHLEELTIKNSSLKELKGLSNLSNLRKLTIGNIKSLHSLDGISDLVNLEQLRIHGCRSVKHLDHISALFKLRHLTLDDAGDFDSLGPIRALHQLEYLYFTGSTNVVDGDLGILDSMPNLKGTAFKNRTHYSRRREELDSWQREVERIKAKTLT